MAKLQKPISSVVTLIEDVNAKRKTARHGYRIPAGKVGTECLRALYYKFRWASPLQEIDGRTARIFQTGEIEEDRLIGELEDAGLIVVDEDIKFDKNGKPQQIGVSFADGHGFGWLDGEIAGIPEAPKKVHVLELKSHNQNSFSQLVKQGVKGSKPEHFGQVQIYMHTRKRDRALYVAVNKNTDEIYSERIEYDFHYCERKERDAKRVVFDATPPPRVMDKPNSFICRMCDHTAICHEGARPEINCRTCIYLTPVSGGTFLCSKFNVSLNRRRQEMGCARHLFLPHLIEGEQVGADLKAGWISYAMRDGSTFENWEPGGDDQPEP